MAVVESKQRKPKILFVVTEDWAFMSHRLPMARAATDLGFEVIVVTRVSAHQKAIEDEGFRVIPFPFNRRNLNPFKELSTIWRLVRIFHAEKPDIVHNVAVKVVLDGTLAALFSPVGSVVNSFIGMGVIFTGEVRGGFLRQGLTLFFRALMANKRVFTIVQNKDDQAMLTSLKISTPERTHLIKGSGVDTGAFVPSPEPEGPVRVVMVSRLLSDKGVNELVEAARLLKQRDCPVQIAIVGTPDAGNPKSISPEALTFWQSEGIVDFQGHRSDIADVWASAHIAVLPSYREGLPKSLLEAASCGRPLIATDVPGCRALVKDGENGLLVPVKDVVALADAIEKLVYDHMLRKKMGRQARVDVEILYADTVVMASVKELYMSSLD